MGSFSSRLLHELRAAVARALDRDGLVNVPAIAWEMMARFPDEKLNFGELEAEVLAAGLARNAALLFHRPASLSANRGGYAGNGATLH